MDMDQLSEIIDNHNFSFKAKGTSVSCSLSGFSQTQALKSTYERYVLKFTAGVGQELILSGTCTICDVMLERGTVVSDWKPSILDNNKAYAELLNLKYIQSAIQDGSTTFNGGLGLTNLLMVGNYVNKVLQNVTGGVSGIYTDDNDVAFWAGGTLEQAIYTVAKYMNDPTAKLTDDELKLIAKFVITHGGRAILNDVIVRGIIYAEGGEFTGKVKSSKNGVRIEIDPDTKNICIYNATDKKLIEIGFIDAAFSLPRIMVNTYNQAGNIIGQTFMSSSNIEIGSTVGADFYRMTISPTSGIDFFKNGNSTKKYPIS